MVTRGCRDTVVVVMGGVKRFIKGKYCSQSTLLRDRLDDNLVEDKYVRVVDVFNT